MTLKKKYLEYKKKVKLAERQRAKIRSSKSWLEIRNLKKNKLALKDALLANNVSN